MAAATTIATKNNRLLSSLLSIFGGVIVSGGFCYPCLFVILNEPCHARFCHFGIVHRSILSGLQILAINAYPSAPPFIRLIAAPPGLISLVPLVMGGGALLLSMATLLPRSPRWLLLMTLGIVAIGLLALVYDTALLNGGVNGFGGYVVTTAIAPPAIAGHAFLYCGYLLLVLGIAQRLRRKS